MSRAKTYMEDAVSLLKELIATPSPSFKEEEACGRLCSFLDSCGIVYHREGNNIVATNRHFDPSLDSLMLNAHIDTVPPVEGYAFDPYSPDYETAATVIPADPSRMESAHGLHRTADGKYDFICGLGSNDDGASAVSLTAAFRYYYDEKMPVNLVLALTSEEERSGPEGMERVWDRLPEITGSARPRWAIVGEPTGMAAATSERGLLVIDAVAEGVSGHAARNEGTNAIDIAIGDIIKLHSHVFRKASPSMGKTNLNVTQIHAGISHNIIPDRCDFVIDIRPTEVYTNQEILDELQSVCKSRLKARNLHNRSSATPVESKLMDCIKSMGIKTFSSPTTSDWMRIGCEAVKMGPGESSRSHRKNEFVYISEIENAIGIYIDFINKFVQITSNGHI